MRESSFGAAPISPGADMRKTPIDGGGGRGPSLPPGRSLRGEGAPLQRPKGAETGGGEGIPSPPPVAAIRSPAFGAPDGGRPSSARPDHKIMTKVPAVISTPPRAVFRVIFSCKKTKASTMVMTTLNLSMGTTRETSPIWMAL